MGECRSHPDIFTPQEAADYLHLDSVTTLETLRRKKLLHGYEGITKGLIYHRKDLDACANAMTGRPVEASRSEMRLTRGGR